MHRSVIFVPAPAAAPPTVHEYWRLLLFSTAGGSAFGFAEVQFRTASGVPLAFSGGAASAATTYGGAPGSYDASKAADGDPNTLYASTVTTPPQWWEYDYGAGNGLDIQEIMITARNDSYWTEAPTSFTPQWSDDGVTWNSLAVVNASWASPGQTQTFAAHLPTLSSTLDFITSFSGGTVRTDSYWAGFGGQVRGADLTVTALGRGTSAGDTANHTVNLLDANGNLLSQVSVPSLAAGTFSFSALSSSITLPAGAAFFIISQEPGGSESWLNNDLAAATSPDAAILNGAYMPTADDGLGIPSPYGTQTFVPVNFQYTKYG